MKVELELYDGRRSICRVPFDGCEFVETKAFSCECSKGETLRAAGVNTMAESSPFETKAPAVCHRCRGSIGELRVSHSTLFGLEEDDAVLEGRARVY